MKNTKRLSLFSLMLVLSTSIAMEKVNAVPLNGAKEGEMFPTNYQTFQQPKKADCTLSISGREIDWQKDAEVLLNRIKNGEWFLYGKYADTLWRLGKYEEAAEAGIQAAIHDDYNWACEIWGVISVDIPNKEEQDLEGAKFPSPEELIKATKLLAENLAGSWGD
ncbi:hypothetical protein [Candidatus Odyssella thessalonicensis]|uniref:hypothetical protein n=1 Tax=Candidatus Odyssella thessalonicensis TaxID=84647 RepID=UPI000225C059|nr:hypothetical protein [Candidatus Odyssella thessalonicensis]